MADETNVLDRLIAQIGDKSLRVRLTREVELLRGSRRFGLVFDRHLPESVRLTDHPIRKGVKVGLRDESTSETWRVTHFADKGRQVAVLDDGGTKHIDELVVTREFGEPIYPGLEPVERIESGAADAPWHAVINGENFHALQALRSTHRAKVDLIYIDPPYNTGGKTSWLYNDRFVEKADRAKSSKWLSFMERRLLIARDLLKDTGAIFVSIGDDEQHRLRMLMDHVFGPENFVRMLTIEMSTTSGPKTTNAQDGTIVKNCEFVLIYRKSPDFDGKVTHRPLYDSVAEWDAHYTLWLHEDGSIGSFAEALAADAEVAKDIAKFDFVTKAGDFVGTRSMDKLLAVSEAANRFVLANLDRIARTDHPPAACKDVEAPIGGWVEVEVEKRKYLMTRLSTGTLNQIYTLSRNYRTSDDYLPTFGRTVIRGDLWKWFHRDMGNISREGGYPFNNGKKPTRLIKQLIRWANDSPDSVILDFFAGSGSTAHAVMDMNHADGGRRQAILVTNNEVGIDVAKNLRKRGIHPGDPEWESHGVFQATCRPRVSSVVTGVHPKISKRSDGYAANVEFFHLTYLDPGRVRRGREYEAIAPLMWLEGGAIGDRIATIPEEGWALTVAYGVLFSIDALVPFAAAIGAATTEGIAPRVVFIVTDSPTEYRHAVERLPVGIETVRLYEDYLSNYTINIEGGGR